MPESSSKVYPGTISYLGCMIINTTNKMLYSIVQETAANLLTEPHNHLAVRYLVIYYNISSDKFNGRNEMISASIAWLPATEEVITYNAPHIEPLIDTIKEFALQDADQHLDKVVKKMIKW